MCVLKDAVPAEPALQSRDHRDELTVTLPPWAVVTSERRAHVERVAALLSTWATAMHASAGERAERDAILKQVAARRIARVIDGRWPLLRETVDFWNALVGY